MLPTSPTEPSSMDSINQPLIQNSLTNANISTNNENAPNNSNISTNNQSLSNILINLEDDNNDNLKSQLSTSESFSSNSLGLPSSESELGTRRTFATAMINQYLENKPKKVFSKKAIVPLAFGAATATCGSVLYYCGGSHRNLQYIIGGIGINYPQSMLYGVGTYNFIRNFKLNSWPQFLGALLVGTTSTAVQVIASIKLAPEDNEFLKYAGPILTFLGNEPNNVFGMYDTFDRFAKFLRRNPELKSTLHQAFKDGLSDDYRLQLRGERSNFGEFISYALGMIGIGGQMDVGQTGYVCYASDFATGLTGKVGLGVALGLLANLPIMLIALLIVGVDFAGNLYDSIAAAKRNGGFELTKGDKAQLIACIANGFLWGYLSWYSSATSEELFDSCPDFGVMQNFMWSETVYGTMAFNFALASLVTYKVSDYLKVALDTNPVSQDKYAVRQIEADILHNLPTDKLEALAEKYLTPEQNSRWKKTTDAKPAFSSARGTTFSASSSSTADTSDYYEFGLRSPKESLCEKLFSRRR